MELRHIRYFKAVAEEKSFTRAAEKLNIAQPPLSRQIQDLEQELDTKLFMRSPHKITLTKEGELFLQYANQILDLVSRSSEEVREVKEGLQGTLPWRAVVPGSLPSGSPLSRRNILMCSTICGTAIPMMYMPESPRDCVKWP